MTEKPRTSGDVRSKDIPTTFDDALAQLVESHHQLNARDADLAAKDRRIEELEGQLKQKITGYTEQIDMMLLDEEQADRKTAALEAQIDRVRALANHYDSERKAVDSAVVSERIYAILGEPAATPERNHDNAIDERTD